MKVEVEKFLPHARPMIMITGGEDLADGEAAAQAIVSEHSVFFDRTLDGVPGCAALEFMAQTMALAVGLRASRRGEAPRIGFILGSRKLEIGIPAFRRGESYNIHARCDYADEEFGSFVCEITDALGAVVASGTLTAYQTEGRVAATEEVVK